MRERSRRSIVNMILVAVKTEVRKASDQVEREASDKPIVRQMNMA